MENISFTSRIVPVSNTDFSRITGSFKRQNFVDYPWTLNEGALAKDTFTKNVRDCTAAILTNGQTSLLLHLCPDTSKLNYSKLYILQYLRNNLDLADKNLQAVLIGSQKLTDSQKIYSAIKEVLTSVGIPISELKFGKAPTNIAYKGSKDEIYVSNQKIDAALKKGLDNKQCLYSGFEQINLADCDNI